MKVVFGIPGCPQPKERARKGAGGRWYTPPKTREYMKRVAQVALVYRPPNWKKDRVYKVEMLVTFPDNRRRDLDNVVKGILDALNGVLWNDDASVVSILVNREVNKADAGVKIWVEST